MPHLFDIDVVSADRKLYAGKAVAVVIPGFDGSFGVLSGHAPMVAALGIGELDIAPPDDKPRIRIAIAGGFAEVMPDRVTILSDAAELAQDISLERARQARERAAAALSEADSAADIEHARIALLRALNRLKVAGGAGM